MDKYLMRFIGQRVEWGYRASLPEVELSLAFNGLHYSLLGLDPFATSLSSSSLGSLDSGVLTAYSLKPMS